MLWSSPAGGLMGPVRMISSGHELTTDYDEKTLHELGFKDMQVTSWFTHKTLSFLKRYRLVRWMIDYAAV